MIEAPSLQRAPRRDPRIAAVLGLSLLLAGAVALFTLGISESSRARPAPSLFLDLAPGRDAANEAAALLGAHLPAATLETLEPGRRLALRLAADDIFVPGTADLRPTLRPAVLRLAALLAAQPAAARVEFDAQFGVGRPRTALSGDAEAERQLAIRRAGALTRALREAGAPVAGLMAGLDHAAAGELRLRMTLGGADRLALGR